jgi:phosphoglycolate phosphatase
MQEYKAVVFDLDGTLLNTVEDIACAMNNVLARNNLPIHPVDNYRFYIGWGLTELVNKTLPKNMCQPQIIEDYVDEVREEYSKYLDSKTRPYDGIAELFDELTARNIPMSILSNKPHQFMHETIQAYFSKWQFKVIFGARDGLPTKPNPHGAMEISEILQLKPQQIVYVGDTDVDMQTAVAAGMYPVGVTWGFRTQEELLANGAKLIIHQPSELIKIFA